MQSFRKNINGITLMALVVTIIILLILAGISIGMLSGDNSIINQAGNAKTQTNIAEEKEIIDITVVHAMGKSKYGDIDETFFTNELEKNNAIVTKSGSKYKVTFASGRQYTVDQDGNVELIPEATGILFEEETASVLKEQTIQLNPTLQPLGAGGTILYKSSDPSTVIVSDLGLVTGVSKGNATITATINGKSATITITVTEPLLPGEKATGGNQQYISDGKTAIIPENFTVSNTDNSINTGLVVIGPDGSEFVWVPIDKNSLKPMAASGDLVNKPMAENVGTESSPVWRGILYDFTSSGYPAYSYADETARNSGYREPDDVTTDSSNSITETTLQNEYNAIIESIKANGGFYVGRYESSFNVSNNVSNIQSKGGIKPANYPYTWYQLYLYQQKYAEIITTGTNLKSTMMTGACYDAMLNWALNSGEDSSHIIATNNAPHKQRSSGNCGSVENDKINNIYDLEGNVREWTLETFSTSNRVNRGR